MRVLICGGRKFNDRGLFAKTMEEYVSKQSEYYSDCDNWLPSDIHIISGGARGADTMAVDWAIVNWTTFTEYKADWKKYKNRAGPIRNQQMLYEGKPDLVIAFPGKRGTADMVRRAKRAGIKVIEVTY